MGPGHEQSTRTVLTPAAVSVVVCTKNSAQTLEESLRSIVANAPGEVVVVDGESSDSTEAIARAFGCRFFSDHGRGLGYARNLGVIRSTGRYVAFVDSDVVLPQGTLETLLRELLREGYAGIHAQMQSRTKLTYWETAEDRHFAQFFNTAGPRKEIATIAAVFDRTVLLAHPFDPFFIGAAEDGDLFIRLNAAGFRLGISSAIAYHQHRSSLREFVEHMIWYGRGTSRLSFRHRSLVIGVAPLGLAVYATLFRFGRGGVRMIPYWYYRTLGFYFGFIDESIRLLAHRQATSTSTQASRR